AEPGWRGLVAQADRLARGWRFTSLTDAVDAAEPGVAVQIRLAAHSFAARDALPVVAGLRPGAVAVVEALRELAARLALADADLAGLPVAAILVADAHHGTFSVAALVSGQTLLATLRGSRRGAAVRRVGDVAVAERLPLAGARLARSRVLRRRGHLRAGFRHALETGGATQGARAGALDPLARGHLGEQEPDDAGRIAVRLRRDVGHDGRGGLLQLDASQHLGQAGLHRRHEGAVEGSRDRERQGTLGAAVLGLGDGPVHRGGVPGAHRLLARVVVGRRP